jgi:hypothetical protein
MDGDQPPSLGPFGGVEPASQRCRARYASAWFVISERAVRLVFEQQENHALQYAAIVSGPRSALARLHRHGTTRAR